MTQELLDKFRSCKPGQTYYVEGINNNEHDSIQEYWYFFECIKCHSNSIKGNDIYEWQNENVQGWTMELEENDTEIGVKKITKMSEKKFRDLYPEHVL